jgi:Lrp/AsnC family transcriptional regulator
LASVLDSTNRRIIALLQSDPDMIQSDIARRLRISQSAVAARLDKLQKSGVFEIFPSLNIARLGLQMGKIDVGTTNLDAVMGWARRCPLLVNASIGVGGQNLSLFFVAEDLEMFQYIVDSHIRRIDGVTDLNFVPILQWAKGFTTQLNLAVAKSETPPCGMAPYCPKCPANPLYNGRVWNSGPQRADPPRFVTSPRKYIARQQQPQEPRQ